MICSYCGDVADLKDNSIIYGKSYGMAYICNNFPTCDSYVGTHKKGLKPLGTIANKELRKLRNEAHLYFDSMWRRKLKTGDKLARKKAYKWLSGELGIEIKNTHIAMFQNDMCMKVIKLCKPYYKEVH